MKKFFFIISILACFIACSSDKEEEIITLELSQSEISFSANEETKDLSVKTNGSWTISDIPDWISIDPKEGKGNYKITLKSEENLKEEERSATLKIVAKDKIKELKIKQNAKNVELSISKPELVFDAEPIADGLTLDIVSNEPWTIVDIPEWCTLSADKGEGNMTITVVVDKNYIDIKRDATIIIKAGSKTEELKLKQEALNIQIVFSMMDLTGTYASDILDMGFYSEASANSIMIRSNTKWTVQSNATWATPDKNNGNGNQPITISVTENKNKTDRNGEVTITAGSKFLKLIIGQGGMIDVTDNPYQINQRDNAPHIGDYLIKKKISYVDPGNGGKNASWNFSNLTVLIDKYEANYRAPNMAEDHTYRLGLDIIDPSKISANSLIIYTDNVVNTMYYYEIKNNQLQAMGHENSTTLLQYNPRMIEDKYPTYYGDSYKYDYQSDVWYSGRNDFRTKGYYEMKADGYGTITLPSGTYNNVLRIKYVQTIQYIPLRGVWEGPLEYEFITYKWYVKGYRYPVLETMRMVDTTGFETASLGFYYPPTDHTYLKQTKQVVSVDNKPITNVRSTPRKTSRSESVRPILQLTK
ncbi:all-beta uncharacterized protein [Dysgonomonas alginatilytica]|uniref:All-beta uncharacterized protein n=1 Tax=Dysgonomonas alginatilytica TaxID=1605892 RepID=A0A2V3PNE6_9BACT|nr:BACON domain-containing protein [Dysgonomonas alginatilytica]PXV63835.1 all-beta uncharacterized protein [Dysgonomonas alginatilytica]